MQGGWLVPLTPHLPDPAFHDRHLQPGGIPGEKVEGLPVALLASALLCCALFAHFAWLQPLSCSQVLQQHHHRDEAQGTEPFVAGTSCTQQIMCFMR